jgi:acetyltransferase-like isoleucine patch superfamily enzyme
MKVTRSINADEAVRIGILDADKDCEIHDTVLFMPGDENIRISKGAVIGPNCILSSGVLVGCNSKLNHNVRLDENCSIGDDCFVGSNCILRPSTFLGNRSVIAHNIVCEGLAIVGEDSIVHDQSHMTLGLKIGDRTFVGAKVMFVNDYKMVHMRKELKDKWKPEAPVVGDGVRIGSGAIIIPRVSIGNNSLIAAGSVVTRHVGENRIVRGIPAKDVGEVPENERI